MNELEDPKCPVCQTGVGDEVDFTLGGEAIYRCDLCGSHFAIWEGQAEAYVSGWS